MNWLRSSVLTWLILLIKFYQISLSKFLPPACRFYPSCSEYSKQAFLKFGIIKGFWLSIQRIIRCHPWSEGGIDYPHTH